MTNIFITLKERTMEDKTIENFVGKKVVCVKLDKLKGNDKNYAKSNLELGKEYVVNAQELYGGEEMSVRLEGIPCAHLHSNFKLATGGATGGAKTLLEEDLELDFIRNMNYKAGLQEGLEILTKAMKKIKKNIAYADERILASLKQTEEIQKIKENKK